MPGAYGILGYGQNSPLWQQYIDLEGNAKYSLRLSESTDSDDQVELTSGQTNTITLGSYGDVIEYVDEPKLEITANSKTYVATYDLESFGFGVVYT